MERGFTTISLKICHKICSNKPKCSLFLIFFNPYGEARSKLSTSRYSAEGPTLLTQFADLGVEGLVPSASMKTSQKRF